MAVMVTHHDLSQNHIDITFCVFVSGSDHLCQRPFGRRVIFFQILRINQPHTVGLFFLPQSVIRSQRNIKIVRLHQNVKSLCI